MAQAGEHLTPTYNWSLGEAFRYLTRAVRLPDSVALYEMEQLRVEVQKYIDGKPQGHGLQSSWLITGNLQSFDLRGEIGRVAADDLGRSPCTLGQQIAQSFAPAD